MTTVDLTLDTEILSDNEVAPRVVIKEVSAATAKCHYCSDTFEGPARFFRRGAHEKKAHNEEWQAAKVPGAKKSVKKTAKKAAPTPRKSTTVTPKAKRISAADTISTNVARVAKLFSGVDVPLSRALVFSAPATGQAVDELVAGTFVDRTVVQKLARVSDKWERLGGVIAFPVLVAVISKNPRLLPVLEDELREATMDVLVANIPTMEKKKARERKAFEALHRLGEVDERFATAADPIGLILQDLFGFTESAEGDGETQ